MKSNMRFHIRLKYMIRFLFILAFFLAVISFSYHAISDDEYNFGTLMNAFTAALGFAQTFIPEVVESVTKRRVRFSEAMQCAIVLFIFCAELLGEIQSFYDKYKWWDSVLHSVSGVILAMIGFMLVSALNNRKSAVGALSPVFVCMFAFFFAVSCGALWEIFEFSGDRLLFMNMQKFRPPDGVNTLYAGTWRYDAGLIDTMTDLILDAICAFVVSLLGYFELKYKNYKNNRHLFSKPLIETENDIKKEEFDIVKK